MAHDPNDPRLTGYALGELEETELPVVYRMLAESPDCRHVVEETRSLAKLLVDQFSGEQGAGLTEQQLREIEERLPSCGRSDLIASNGSHLASIPFANTNAGSKTKPTPVASPAWKFNMARWGGWLAAAAALVSVGVALSRWAPNPMLNNNIVVGVNDNAMNTPNANAPGLPSPLPNMRAPIFAAPKEASTAGDVAAKETLANRLTLNDAIDPEKAEAGTPFSDLSDDASAGRPLGTRSDPAGSNENLRFMNRGGQLSAESQTAVRRESGAASRTGGGGDGGLTSRRSFSAPTSPKTEPAPAKASMPPPAPVIASDPSSAPGKPPGSPQTPQTTTAPAYSKPKVVGGQERQSDGDAQPSDSYKYSAKVMKAPSGGPGGPPSLDEARLKLESKAKMDSRGQKDSEDAGLVAKESLGDNKALAEVDLLAMGERSVAATGNSIDKKAGSFAAALPKPSAPQGLETLAQSPEAAQKNRSRMYAETAKPAASQPSAPEDFGVLARNKRMLGDAQMMGGGGLGGMAGGMGISGDKDANANPMEARGRVENLAKHNEAEVLGRVNKAEEYEPIQEIPFRLTRPSSESTFAADVDTASYSNMRRFLTQSQWPPKDSVRVEEMVNYFTYNDPEPTNSDPLSVNTEIARCPWNPETRLMRIALQAKRLSSEKRPDTNLVMLLDVSGSMSDANKLPLLKTSMKMVVKQLSEKDRVAIVTYSDTARVALESTLGTKHDEMIRAIDSLQASGSTNGSAGLIKAYEVAVQNFRPNGVNRVILCSDGDFNVDVTTDNELVRLIEGKAKSNVYLSVFGIGMGNLKDAKLQKIADKGNGHHGYIDSLQEACKMLVTELNSTLVTVAKDVKIQVDFNPEKVLAYRLIGYENRAMANTDFRNDSKDAGEIGAGHAVTALYEVIPANSNFAGRYLVELSGEGNSKKPETSSGSPASKTQTPPDNASSKVAVNAFDVDAKKDEAKAKAKAPVREDFAKVRFRYIAPEGGAAREVERVATDTGKDIAATSEDFRFASSVAAFGQLLRGSRYAGNATFDSVLELAKTSIGSDPNNYRREFLELVGKARALRPTTSPHLAQEVAPADPAKDTPAAPAAAPPVPAPTPAPTSIPDRF